MAPKYWLLDALPAISGLLATYDYDEMISARSEGSSIMRGMPNSASSHAYARTLKEKHACFLYALGLILRLPTGFLGRVASARLCDETISDGTLFSLNSFSSLYLYLCQKPSFMAFFHWCLHHHFIQMSK
ncbi:hypothetical protein R3P38DRAFT_2911393 [Favolaschia claudopus]|uniref:Uncharacterized protein n=1 Tax=Favolaschia claudopus TaxID=2862362 RepID=A0AAW0CBV1_9AGAR